MRESSGPGDRIALQSVRWEVFVQEQKVPHSFEFDGHDATTLH